MESFFQTESQSLSREEICSQTWSRKDPRRGAGHSGARVGRSSEKCHRCWDVWHCRWVEWHMSQQFSAKTTVVLANRLNLSLFLILTILGHYLTFIQNPLCLPSEEIHSLSHSYLKYSKSASTQSHMVFIQWNMSSAFTMVLNGQEQWD